MYLHDQWIITRDGIISQFTTLLNTILFTIRSFFRYSFLSIWIERAQPSFHTFCLYILFIEGKSGSLAHISGSIENSRSTRGACARSSPFELRPSRTKKKKIGALESQWSAHSILYRFEIGAVDHYISRIKKAHNHRPLFDVARVSIRRARGAPVNWVNANTHDKFSLSPSPKTRPSPLGKKRTRDFREIWSRHAMRQLGNRLLWSICVIN